MSIVDQMGNGLGRSKQVPPSPGEPMGDLTPLHAARGHARYWHFRCKCGELVIREISQVRRAVRDGGRPACATCNKARASENRKKAKP